MCNVRILLLLLLGCYGAVAAAEDFVDPPGRVARLSFIDGAVSVAPPGSDQWGEALLNRPLTTGDRIWADAGGRAELEVGSATLRIDENTGLSFDNLTDDVMQIHLTSGVMALHVGSLGTGQVVEVATPNATVNLLQRGDYTIETTQSGDQTIVKTHSGEATVAGSSQQAYGVATNEQGVFTGITDFTSEITGIEPRSRFEEWAYAREVRDQDSVSARYVSREVIGYRDLDTYGTWYTEPDYGYVWRPTLLVADWAPYRYGRWIWVAPWGWTWVDDAPWGFAPSHYGRWAYIRHRWCWVPGPLHIRPVYAPALVGWVGDPFFGNPGYIGQVGWFPLAPREAYVPCYRTSWRHFHNVNVSNTVIVNNTYINNLYQGRAAPIDYHNRRVPHALTVVQRDDFVSARRVGDHRKRVSDDQVRNWPVQGRAPTITPNHDSMIGTRVSMPRGAPQSDRWVNPNRTAIAPSQNERAAIARQPRDDTTPQTMDRPVTRVPAPTPDREYRTGQSASADRHNRDSRNAARMPTETGAQNGVPAENEVRTRPTNRVPATPTPDRQDRTGQSASADRPNRDSRNATRMPTTETGAQNEARAPNGVGTRPSNRVPANSERGAPRPHVNPPIATQNVTPQMPAEQHVERQWRGRRDDDNTHARIPNNVAPPPQQQRSAPNIATRQSPERDVRQSVPRQSDNVRSPPRPVAPTAPARAPGAERQQGQPPAQVSQRAAMGTPHGRQDTHDARGQQRSQDQGGRAQPGAQPQQQP